MTLEQGSADSGPPTRLDGLYASWGVFDLFHETLDQLPPDWLVVFHIARNLIDGNPIPSIEIPKTLEELLRGTFIIDYERRLVEAVERKESILPTETLQIRPIRALPEVVRALPADLLLERISPTLFWLKAITGALLVARPEEPQTVVEEIHGTREELVLVMKRQGPPRQKVYVLLDVSESMRDASKLMFAKAVILAYLLRARGEHAEIHFRSFTTVTSDRMDCVTDQAFSALAGHVLKLEAGGSTNIGLAIKTCVDNIDTMHHLARVRSGVVRPVPTELLLISDCGSYTGLPRISNGIKLHTVHLEGGDEQSATPLDYSLLVQEIKDRSETFTRIDTSFLAVPASRDEAHAVHREIQELEGLLISNGSKGIPAGEEVLERVNRVNRVARVYKKIYQGKLHDAMDSQHILNAEWAEALYRLLSWDGIKQRIRDALDHTFKRKAAAINNLKRLNQGGTRLPGITFRRVKSDG